VADHPVTLPEGGPPGPHRPPADIDDFLAVEALTKDRVREKLATYGVGDAFKS